MKKSILFTILSLLSFSSFAQSYFQQAMDAYKAEDYDKALEFLDKDIENDPKSAYGYYFRGVIYLSKDQNALALSDLSNATKYFKSKDASWLGSAYQKRGRVYAKIGENQNAFADFEKALKLSDEKEEVYISRADLYIDLEQFDKAESDFKEALKIKPGDVRLWAGLGRNYLIAERYTDAEKVLNKAILLDSDDFIGYYYRSFVYAEQKKYREAIDDIFYCFILQSADKDIRYRFLEYANENIPYALSKINPYLIANPEKEQWYFVRAQLYEEQNNFKNAINDYGRILELIDPDYKYNILAYRAVCYSNAGMHALAIRDLNESIILNPAQAYNYAYRGDAKRLMKDFKGALADFDSAIEIDPAKAWFYYRRGWVKDEFLKDYQGGLEDYNQSIALDKDYAYSYLHRGRLYSSKLNDQEKAKQDFLKILELDTVKLKRGNCKPYALFHLGRNEEAIALTKEILDNYPTNGNYYDATCLYSLMNKPAEALTFLKLAFQKGYKDFDHLSIDDDVDNIRNLAEFKRIVQDWKNKFNDNLKLDTDDNALPTQKKAEHITIPMKPKGSGVYEVACKINDLPLNFIFDTGASDITISKTEALFMLKNGYLKSGDFAGSQNYMDANGDITTGTNIILRKVDFGGVILKNIKASVINNNKAPLLFGQSALSKYGKIEIDNKKNTLTIINSY